MAGKMSRSQRKVAGLSDAQRRFHGLEVAHFPDQNHVRILAQGDAQRISEGMRVAVHLALIDDAALVRVQELDRILDCKDVFVALPVDLVDHRRQGGGLAASGRSGDEDEAARLVAQFLHHRRKAEGVKALNLEWNHAKNRCYRAALRINVGAETAEVLDAEGEVILPFFLEGMFLRVGHDTVGEAFGIGRRQRRLVHRAQLAVDAHLRRRPDCQVQVGSARLCRLVKHFGQCEHVGPFPVS